MNESQQPAVEPPIAVIEWFGDADTGHLRLLDQTLLPTETAWLDCTSVEDVWDAIRRLVVRGAPAIGVAAAYGMVVAVQQVQQVDQLDEAIDKAAAYLESSRPTAVNLSWAVRRMQQHAAGQVFASASQVRQGLLALAREIHAEDRRMCLEIGRHAAELIRRHQGVLTHCNAGALATAGIGTATAGMYLAHATGHSFRVFCDETRPLLQGSRLTAWELSRAGIDATVICDNMAAQVLREGKAGMVITGADRIAANGDAANKIGTYQLAIAARHHGVPFYVAAPYSTFDMSLDSGEQIPIELRGREEITCGFGKTTAPDEAKTYSPAFDVTPAGLIDAIVTDRGVIQPVNAENVRRMIPSGE
ncbi:MAG: S-methyl-5-thioribose-1-phosphate isomerase [Planctomycetota bacterium]